MAELLTVKEVAELFHVKADTVHKMIKRGSLRFVRIPDSRKKLIRAVDIQEIINAPLRHVKEVE